MILDDEDLIRESMGDFFEDCGWNVITTDNGHDALSLLEKTQPELALVDVRLGDMLGVEFIRKAHPLCPQLKYFVFTGSPEYVLPQDINDIPEVYFDIIKKPIMNLMEFQDKAISFLESGM